MQMGIKSHFEKKKKIFYDSSYKKLGKLVCMTVICFIQTCLPIMTQEKTIRKVINIQKLIQNHVTKSN